MRGWVGEKTAISDGYIHQESSSFWFRMSQISISRFEDWEMNSVMMSMLESNVTGSNSAWWEVELVKRRLYLTAISIRSHLLSDFVCRKSALADLKIGRWTLSWCQRQGDGSGTQDSCANVQNTSLRNELWEALGLEKKSDYENPMQIFNALPVADTHRH